MAHVSGNAGHTVLSLVSQVCNPTSTVSPVPHLHRAERPKGARRSWIGSRVRVSRAAWRRARFIRKEQIALVHFNNIPRLQRPGMGLGRADEPGPYRGTYPRSRTQAEPAGHFLGEIEVSVRSGDLRFWKSQHVVLEALHQLPVHVLKQMQFVFVGDSNPSDSADVKQLTRLAAADPRRGSRRTARACSHRLPRARTPSRCRARAPRDRRGSGARSGRSSPTSSRRDGGDPPRGATRCAAPDAAARGAGAARAPAAAAPARPPRSAAADSSRSEKSSIAACASAESGVGETARDDADSAVADWSDRPTRRTARLAIDPATSPRSVATPRRRGRAR